MSRISKTIILVVMLLVSTNMNAQSFLDKLKDAATGVVSSLTSGSAKQSTIIGTWSYTGAAIEAKSNDALAKLGAAAAKSTLENKINTYLSKILSAGNLKMQFDANNNLIVTLKSKSKKGSYSLNNGKLNIKLLTLGNGFNCDTNLSLVSLELLVSADKLMTFINGITSFAGNFNTSIKAISSLLGNFNGMQIGLKFKKVN